MKTLRRTRGLAHDLVVTRDGTKITLWSAAGIRHTVLDLGAPHMPGLEYARNSLVVLAFSPQARSFLILGLGGGSIPRMLLAARPAAVVDAVEIDPAISDLAHTFFRIGALPRFEVHMEDAAAFLAHSRKNYDVIIVDSYIGDCFPEQCATREFFLRARDRLTSAGVLAINWMSDDSAVFGRLKENLESTLGPIWRLPGTRSRNTLLFVSNREITRRDLMADAQRIEREIPFPCSLSRLAMRLQPGPGGSASRRG